MGNHGIKSGKANGYLVNVGAGCANNHVISVFENCNSHIQVLLSS